VRYDPTSTVRRATRGHETQRDSPSSARFLPRGWRSGTCIAQLRTRLCRGALLLRAHRAGSGRNRQLAGAGRLAGGRELQVRRRGRCTGDRADCFQRRNGPRGPGRRVRSDSLTRHSARTLPVTVIWHFNLPRHRKCCIRDLGMRALPVQSYTISPSIPHVLGKASRRETYQVFPHADGSQGHCRGC
jgi:hypothetical protein